MKAIRDLINGNLTDAKAAANSRTYFSILNAAQDQYGMSLEEARNTADYLKGIISHKTYCQNSHAINN